MTKKKTPQKNASPKSSSSKNTFESRIQDLMDLDTPTIVTLYGKPGTGKTTIASTAPKPLLFIDVKDKGMASAKNPHLKRGDIKVFELEEFDDIYEVYDYIMENPGKFKSVAIDHFTALQEYALEKVKEEEKKEKISQQMFGFAASYMREVITMYKNLTDVNINPIFLCQDRLENGEGDGEDQLTPEVGPALMPSLSRVLCSASRVIGHTYLQERVDKTNAGQVKRSIEYRLRLGPNPYYITKVTRPQGTPCPSYLVNAQFGDILQIVKGEYQENKPKKSKKLIK